MEENTLEVSRLTVRIPSDRGIVRPVQDVSLTVPAGKTVGIVGESGCGKSMTARAVMGLLRDPARVEQGSIRLCGRELTSLPGKERRRLCGSEMSMIFQEPMTSLNPVMKVGKQVAEAIRLHTGCGRDEARERTLDLFRGVEIPEPENRYGCYPHQLSGGLRQRVMIAMAMACRPKLVIADEPTTALDVTVEAQILELLSRLCGGGTSVLIISHNLGVIARICDYVYVMYAGRVVEQAETDALFRNPLHPYTRGLLRSVLSLRGREDLLAAIPGTVPNLLHLPAGCGFSPRCGRRREECEKGIPPMAWAEPGHGVRCLCPEGRDGR